MSSKNEILSAEGIKRYWPEGKCHVFNTIPSTNAHAKQMALQGAEEGTLVAANHQTAGRGRMGRSFYSPADTGLYMSLILRPNARFEQIQMLTIAAAVAVCEALEAAGEKPQIKWVNDVYIAGRKVCGILSEAVNDYEKGIVKSVIVGIGVNCSTEQFPQEIQHVAGSLQRGDISRNKLAADISRNLLSWQTKLDQPELIKAYKQRSFLLGKEIEYQQNGEVFAARVMDINEKGNLVVQSGQGEIAVLQSGEVSMKAWQEETGTMFRKEG